MDPNRRAIASSPRKPVRFSYRPVGGGAMSWSDHRAHSVPGHHGGRTALGTDVAPHRRSNLPPMSDLQDRFRLT